MTVATADRRGTPLREWRRLGSGLTDFYTSFRVSHTVRLGIWLIQVSECPLIGNATFTHHRRHLWGHYLHIAALRLDDGSLLVIATQTAPKSAITDYVKRWGIK